MRIVSLVVFIWDVFRNLFGVADDWRTDTAGHDSFDGKPGAQSTVGTAPQALTPLRRWRKERRRPKPFSPRPLFSMIEVSDSILFVSHKIHEGSRVLSYKS